MAPEWVVLSGPVNQLEEQVAVAVNDHMSYVTQRCPVGFTALYGLFRPLAPELGILIGDRLTIPLAARLAEALTLTVAFDRFGAHRVYGLIAARNRAARWVVESLGFQREALMRQHLKGSDSHVEDCEVWGVLPAEFRSTAADLEIGNNLSRSYI